MLQRIKASDKKIINLAYALNDINKLKKQHIELYERQVSYIESVIGTLKNYYYFTIYVSTDDNRNDLDFQFSFSYGAVKIYLLNNSLMKTRCRDLRFLNLDVPNEFRKIIIDNLDLINFND